MADYDLTLAEARAVAVAAQGFADSSPTSHPSPGRARSGKPAKPAARSRRAVLEQLGCVQIDAIQAVRRSHDLAFLARGADPKPPTPPTDPGRSAGSSTTCAPYAYEAWGHAHSLLPVALWPHLAWHRRYLRDGGLRGPAFDPAVADRVLATIAAEGPMAHSDLEKSTGSGWGRSSPSRWACEWLAAVGDLVCVTRDEKWRRVYSLPESTLPSHVFHHNISDEEGYATIVQVALRAVGVGTVADVADYFRLPKRRVATELARAEYPTVAVEGSTKTWYTPGEPRTGTGPKHLVPLSPLDSLVWTRSRQATLFGCDYRMECYKPQAKREFGYFGMPLLHGTDLVGRVAARREGTTMRIEAIEVGNHVTDSQLTAVTQLLATWAGCDDVRWDATD